MNSEGFARARPLVSYITPFLSSRSWHALTHFFLVSPIAGKQNGMEVLIQGNQSKAASEYLINNRVPKAWIEVQGQGKR